MALGRKEGGGETEPSAESSKHQRPSHQTVTWSIDGCEIDIRSRDLEEGGNIQNG